MNRRDIIESGKGYGAFAGSLWVGREFGMVLHLSTISGKIRNVCHYAGDELDVEPPPPATLVGIANQRVRFRALYDEGFRKIYAFVVRSLPHDRSLVDDVVADIFLTVWRRIDDVPMPPEDHLWLFGVARNVIARHRRTESRRMRLVERLTHERPPAVFHGSDLHQQVVEAVNILPRRDREAVHLVLWENLTHREAAAVLGCSENAVRIRIHRARKRLAERFNITDPDEISTLANLQLDLETPI